MPVYHFSNLNDINKWDKISYAAVKISVLPKLPKFWEPNNDSGSITLLRKLDMFKCPLTHTSLNSKASAITTWKKISSGSLQDLNQCLNELKTVSDKQHNIGNGVENVEGSWSIFFTTCTLLLNQTLLLNHIHSVRNILLDIYPH